MKYRIIKSEFSDGTIRYKAQYKEYKWIPWWNNFRWREPNGAVGVVHNLWFDTAEEALNNFKEHTSYFNPIEPTVVKSSVVQQG